MWHICVAVFGSDPLDECQPIRHFTTETYFYLISQLEVNPLLTAEKKQEKQEYILYSRERET